MVPTESLDLTRRLLAYEAITGKTSEPAQSAALRVYEKLRRPLFALIGVAGFRSLASRALTLGKVCTCAVKAGAFPRGTDPPGNWFVPPGNNRSDGRGDEVVGAFDAKSRSSGSVSM